MNPYLLLGTGLAVAFLWLRSHTPATLGGNQAGQQATTPGVDSASGGASGGDGQGGFVSPYGPLGTISYGPPTQTAPDPGTYAQQASQPDGMIDQSTVDAAHAAISSAPAYVNPPPLQQQAPSFYGGGITLSGPASSAPAIHPGRVL